MRLVAAVLFVFLMTGVVSAQPVIYNGPGDGVTDNVTAFNTAVSNVCASTTTRTLSIPPGHYRFASPPAAIPCALNIAGEGKAVTWLVRDYSGLGGYFLKITGGQDTYGGGSIRDLSIYTSPNGTDGIAVWVVASPDADPNALSKNPHGFLMENVQIGRYSTAGGQWTYGVYLDGSLNTGPGALGIRAITLRSVSVATASLVSYVINKGFGIKFDGVDCFGWGIIVNNGTSIVDIYSPNCGVSNDGTATSIFTVQ